METNRRHHARCQLLFAVLCALSILLPSEARTSTDQSASPESDSVAEIRLLLDMIAASDCRFKRNGTWHRADAAASHIERKYHAVKERGLIETTADFITHAATRSSLTGKEYLVQCGNEPAVSSADWLHATRAQLRVHGTQKHAPKKVP
jgi:hypothetical protein